MSAATVSVTPAEAGSASESRPAPAPTSLPVRTSYAVWETTLRCNLACKHCGSRAGQVREGELDTAEAIELIRQLAELGIGEVTLGGGEVTLRRDWQEIAAAIHGHGMVCTLLTGGLGVSAETARRMKQAGVAFASTSVDGLESTHDRLRGVSGSWKGCFRTLGHFRDAGLPFGVNTQINRLTAPELPELYQRLRDAGVSGWQVQLTVPMGNAADRAEIVLQPCELLDLFPMLARVVHRAHCEGVQVIPANCIGYFGPYESVLRERNLAAGAFWMGCQAGLHVLGIEADGSIKGCLSLPSVDYVGGNIRERPLREILDSPQLRLNFGGGTPEGTGHLWGHCAACEFADLCRAGCTQTSHTFFGRRGNNPYCHRRALDLAERGLRERLVLKVAAAGRPFDHAIFELVEEPLDAPWPEGDPLHFTAERIGWPESWAEWPSF